MSTDSPPSPYDAIPDIGLLYDSVPAYVTRPDVAFYVREAAGVEDAVLKLGCGTGRILLPLARAGHTVVGLDSSQRMLAHCRAKLGDEAESVQIHVALAVATPRLRARRDLRPRDRSADLYNVLNMLNRE